MKKLFFDHLLLIDDVTAVIDTHDLSPQQRQELIDLVDHTLQLEILSEILTHLPRKHHETFLGKLHQAPHDPEIMVFLQTHVMGIDQIIFKKAATVKKRIIRDLKR